MKNYSVESSVRKKAVAVTAIAAFAGAILLYEPTNKLVDAIVTVMPSLALLENIGLIGVLEPMAIFGLIWALFDNVIWKWPIVKRWHRIPYIGGSWKGELESSHQDENGNRTIMPMRMVIKQTFTNMTVHCSFATSSESYATVVGIVRCDEASDECTLEFTYNNTAIDESVAFDSGRDNTHSGFTILRIIGDRAVGDYATLRSKKTHGHINLSRDN